MVRRSNFPRLAKDLYSTPTMALVPQLERLPAPYLEPTAVDGLVAGRPKAQIENAALWLAATNEQPRPLIPHLRKTFGLSTAEAIRVIRLANAARGQS